MSTSDGKKNHDSFCRLTIGHVEFNLGHVELNLGHTRRRYYVDNMYALPVLNMTFWAVPFFFFFLVDPRPATFRVNGSTE